MFRNLYRSIYLPVILLSVALILFIDVFSVIVLTQTLQAAHNGMDQKRVARALDSCELYIRSVAASTYNLSLNSEVTEELLTHSGKSLTRELDDTCNYSLKINAVCAYSADGTVYASSGIAQVPSLDGLKENVRISKFIDGDDSEMISFRTESVAKIYNNVSYPAKMGVITCCRKVYYEGEVIGWLFADILPSTLYSLLFDKGQFNNAVAFITFGDSYFEYSDNTAQEALLNGRHDGYFKYSSVSDDGLFSLTVFNSTKEYVSQLAILISILLAASIILATGAHFAAKFTAKSVTNRLDGLISKMNSQEIA